jgi:hypothetical protein
MISGRSSLPLHPVWQTIRPAGDLTEVINKKIAPRAREDEVVLFSKSESITVRPMTKWNISGQLLSAVTDSY